MKREYLEWCRKHNFHTIYHLCPIIGNDETTEDYSFLNVNEILEWESSRLENIEKIYFTGDLDSQKTAILSSFINSYGFFKVNGVRIPYYCDSIYDYIQNVISICFLHHGDKFLSIKKIIDCVFKYDSREVIETKVTIQDFYSKKDFLNNYKIYLKEQDVFPIKQEQLGL